MDSPGPGHPEIQCYRVEPGGVGAEAGEMNPGQQCHQPVLRMVLCPAQRPPCKKAEASRTIVRTCILLVRPAK